ncbi:MAG: HypC/HybG/HupF family hydrogenase formation chaperone [Betaproteobacteria bacterium]|nr:HypC/HybG/HupF family hydrogenase formation chaperone [Betaproteobacteria bacterium]
MCLAIPTRVIEVHNEFEAIVELAGVRKLVSIALVENVQVGDFVILHVGHALTKLDPDEARKTLELMAEAGLAVDPATA